MKPTPTVLLSAPYYFRDHDLLPSYVEYINTQSQPANVIIDGLICVNNSDEKEVDYVKSVCAGTCEVINMGQGTRDEMIRLGHQKAIDKALKEKFDYLWFVGADTAIMDEDVLKELLKHIIKPKVGAVSAKMHIRMDLLKLSNDTAFATKAMVNTPYTKFSPKSMWRTALNCRFDIKNPVVLKQFKDKLIDYVWCTQLGSGCCVFKREALATLPNIPPVEQYRQLTGFTSVDFVYTELLRRIGWTLLLIKSVFVGHIIHDPITKKGRII